MGKYNMEIRFDRAEANKLIEAMETHSDHLYNISKAIADLMCNFKEWDDGNRKKMETALQELNEGVADIVDNESHFIDCYKSKLADLEA